MFCGECGTQNPDTNQFCRNCGKPLTKRPAAQPAVLQPVQPAAVPVVPAPGPAPVATPKRKWNWPGIVSLILGILSWVILTGLLAIGAILLGIVALAWFRKATGRIGISALAGILLGTAAIAANLLLA
jgi:zinc-ribbon domain